MQHARIDPMDETIRTAAVRRLGVVDASVLPIAERKSYLGDGIDRWFGLFVTVEGESTPRMIARRRTKSELLTLVSTCGPERLGDWPPLQRRPTQIESHAPHRPQNRVDAPNRSKPRSFGGRSRGWRVADMSR